MGIGEYIGEGSSNQRLLWHLNGNSNDSSGNSLTGTDTSISYSKSYGKFNEGALFNGSSSQIYVQNSLIGFSGTQNFTQSVWVYVTILPSSGKRYDVTMVQSGTNVDIFDKGISIYSDGRASFYVYSGGVYEVFTPMNTIQINKWYNLVATYVAGYISIYINGSFINKLSAPGTYSHTSARFVLGHKSTNAAYSYYNGYIDEVSVLARAMSAIEIQKYYTNALGMF